MRVQCSASDSVNLGGGGHYAIKDIVRFIELAFSSSSTTQGNALKNINLRYGNKTSNGEIRYGNKASNGKNKIW